MKDVSEERGKRPAFLGPTKSAEGASLLKHHTQQISPFALIAVVLVVMLGMLIGSWSCSRKTKSIAIGTPLNESSALIYIAEEQHFFTGNGLNVTVRDYDFGALALNGMLRGEPALEFLSLG